MSDHYHHIKLRDHVLQTHNLRCSKLKVHDGSNFIPDSSESDLGSKEGSFLAEKDDVECIGQNQ